MKKLLTLALMLCITCHLSAQVSNPGHPFGNNLNKKSSKPKALQILAQRAGFPVFQPMLHPAQFNKANSKFAFERLDSMLVEYNASVWLLAYKALFTWNAQQRLIKQENHQFDDVLMQMVPTDRVMVDYNANGDVILQTSEYFNAMTNQWEGDHKTEYTWNAGKMATSAFWFWDSSDSSWHQGNRGAYYYLPNGYLSHAIFEYWDDFTNQWEIGYKQELTYNASNQVILDMYSFWDASLMQYFPGSKDEYTYHANGKVSLFTTSFYDAFEMAWIPERMEESVYDANANKTLLTGSRYDYFDSAWVYDFREERSYDSLNNVSLEVYSTYDAMSSTWIPDERTGFIFDNNHPYLDLLLPFTMFGGDDPQLWFNHKITKANTDTYEQSSQSWLPLSRSDLYWSSVLIGVEEVADRPEIAVFPNPANDMIIFDGGLSESVTRFIMTDMQSRVVVDQQVVSGDKIGTQHLRPGMYVYQISNSTSILFNGKLLIVR